MLEVAMLDEMGLGSPGIITEGGAEIGVGSPGIVLD